MILGPRLAVAIVALVCASGAAHAADVSVKIGVLSDMSSLYSDIGGAGSVAAAKLAVEDFNPAAHGMKVEVVSADHQNKPDVGAGIALQWYDVDHVDVIVDVPTSSVALAVSEVTREKNKVFLGSGPASSDLTGPKCSPNTIQWTYDTWMLANSTGKALVKTGGDTWFFLTSDYAFGHALERDTAAVVEKNGGKVLGQACAIRSITVTSPHCWCRRRLQKRKSSGLLMRAATPSMQSSRAPNSASTRAVNISLVC